MIDSRMLPPSCKDLASILVHLSPPKFHKGLQRCTQKKLLKRTVADNVQVRVHLCLLSLFFFSVSYVPELWFSLAIYQPFVAISREVGRQPARVDGNKGTNRFLLGISLICKGYQFTFKRDELTYKTIKLQQEVEHLCTKEADFVAKEAGFAAREVDFTIKVEFLKGEEARGKGFQAGFKIFHQLMLQLHPNFDIKAFKALVTPTVVDQAIAEVEKGVVALEAASEATSSSGGKAAAPAGGLGTGFSIQTFFSLLLPLFLTKRAYQGP